MNTSQLHPQFLQHMRLQGLNPADPRHQAAYCQLLYQQQAAQQPMYASNRSGPPVNITKGVVLTEARGVFVSGLNFRCNEAAISAYFKAAGNITHLDLHRDHQTKKSKGTCTIHFDTARAAQTAIAMFHNNTFMDMRLKVREDRERTALVAPTAGPAPAQQVVRNPGPPLIVSSTPTQSHRVPARAETQR